MSNRVKHIHKTILPKINSFLSNKFTNISSQIHPQWQQSATVEEQVPDNSLTSPAGGGTSDKNRGLTVISTSITGIVYDFFNFHIIAFFKSPCLSLFLKAMCEQKKKKKIKNRRLCQVFQY